MLSLGDIFLTPASARLHSLPSASKPAASDDRKRPAPFSIRLSAADRQQLEREAGGRPLGSYIKEKMLETPPPRVRRAGLAVRDQQVLAQLVAHLGRTHAFHTLSALHELAQAGALPFTPETENALLLALADLTEMRQMLMRALGLKTGDAP